MPQPEASFLAWCHEPGTTLLTTFQLELCSDVAPQPQMPPKMQQTKPTRIIIRACVTDISDIPEERPFQLGDAFCRQKLKRPIMAKVKLPVYDNIHYLPNFNSPRGNAWFIYDLYVTGSADLSHIPHEVYLATCHREGDSVSWIFTERTSWVGNAKSYASMYTWGGAAEQERLANLKRESRLSTTVDPDSSYSLSTNS